MGIGRVPPNVKFLVDDIESEWAYESNPFDYIHARNLAVSIRDFGKLIKQCYRYVDRSFPLFFVVLDSNVKQISQAWWLG